MNKAFRHALRDIFGDGALIIFMVIVPIVYPIVYALIYNTEAVHEVPVVVVDKAGNATSRDFLNRLDASPDAHIAATATIDQLDSAPCLPAAERPALNYLTHLSGIATATAQLLVSGTTQLDEEQFNSKITVENITRATAPVSAKSLMKVVALGVTAGHRLRFVAEGEDAQQALEAIRNAIVSGLGETVSAVPPSEPDSIESVAVQSAVEKNGEIKRDENLPAGSVEAVFTVRNEHGLHARPAAMLVNEVKRYSASVAVQNLDRNSPLVSAKSLMKVVALGVVKGHRLRFVATGEDAQKAIDGIGTVIEAGLGE